MEQHLTMQSNRKPTNRLLDLQTLLNDDLIKVHEYEDPNKSYDELTQYYSDTSLREILEKNSIWQFQ